MLELVILPHLSLALAFAGAALIARFWKRDHHRQDVLTVHDDVEGSFKSIILPREEERDLLASNPSIRKRDKIGLFDSGVGGLTVYMQLKKEFPDCDVVYFADMARQPYGPRSQSEVAEFCDEILRFLKREGCGLAVIACNTATAAAFDHAVHEQPEFNDFPVFGTIPFACAEALRACSTNRASPRIGVIATQGTCDSGAYKRQIAELVLGKATVIQMPCPEFMGIAEVGGAALSSARTEELARQYLAPCTGGRVDVLIYGCTHYPLLESVVRRVMATDPRDRAVRFVDPAVSLVANIKHHLTAATAAVRDGNETGGPPRTRFVVNANPKGFAERASRILGHDVSSQCEVVRLGT